MYAGMHIFSTFDNSWESIGLYRGKRTLSIFAQLWAYFFHFPVSFLKNWFMANSEWRKRVKRGAWQGGGSGLVRKKKPIKCLLPLSVWPTSAPLSLCLLWFRPYIFPLKALSHRQPQPKLLNNQAYRSVFNNPLSPGIALSHFHCVLFFFFPFARSINCWIVRLAASVACTTFLGS